MALEGSKKWEWEGLQFTYKIKDSRLYYGSSK